MHIANYIDHTLLKPTATTSDIKQLCKEAIQYQFFSVCVNSNYTSLARKMTQKENIKICSVVGFPLGAMHTKAKCCEAKIAIEEGADEIDMVINIGALKAGDYENVQNDIAAVKNTIGDKILKVILETCYLSDAEIIKACELAVAAKTDFVKTSTGFGTAGATLEHVTLMKTAVAGKAAIKASGGIRDYKTAKQYIDLGVSRIGTSNGIAIVTKNTSTSNTY